MCHRGDAVVFLLTSTRKTTTLWSWTSHASWEERAGEPRHTFPLSLLIWHEHLNSFKNVLHPVFQSQCGCITARMSNWSASLIFFSAHPVGPIANNQVISPLIKWCTEDLSFRLLWGSAHLDPQFLSSPLMRYWRLLSATISAPLLSPCHCACFFFCGLFSECPQLHSGRALQMRDDPVISVWLLMLRNAFSTNQVVFGHLAVLVSALYWGFSGHLQLHWC